MTEILLGLATVVALAGWVYLAQRPEWLIGPIVQGENKSVGVPSEPFKLANALWYFDFPHPDRVNGHVHSVSTPCGSLKGKKRIRIRYRIEGAETVRFPPQEEPFAHGILSLMIQRKGDNWSGKGKYEFYRCYAPEYTVQRLAPGEHLMQVELIADNWIPVMGSPLPAKEFFATLDNADSIHLCFGGGGSRAHGVFATSAAKFILREFAVE